MMFFELIEQSIVSCTSWFLFWIQFKKDIKRCSFKNVYAWNKYLIIIIIKIDSSTLTQNIMEKLQE